MTQLGALQSASRIAPSKPHWTYIPFVRAALRCQASLLRIAFDGNSTRFEWDGQPLAEPERLLELGLESAKYRPERHLTAGLYGLWKSGSGPVLYECWNGHTGVQWKLSPTRVTVKPLTRSPGVAHRVSLTGKKGWRPFEGLFGNHDRPTAVPPEFAVLRDICRFAPLDLQLNGERISHPVDLGRSLVCVLLEPPPEVKPLILADQTTICQLTVCAGQPYSAILAVGGSNPQLASLNLVVNGLLVKVEDPELLSMGIRCVMRCEEMELDDQGKVMEDDVYAAVVADLLAKSLTIGERLASHLGEMSTLDRAEAGILVKHYADRQAQQGQWVQAEQMLQNLLQAQEGETYVHPSDLAGTLVRLGDLRLRQQNFAGARADYQRSLDLLGNTPTEPLALIGLAEVALSEGDLETADRLARQILREHRQLLDPLDPRLAGSCQLLARVYRASQPIAEEPLYEVDKLYLEALRILERNYGPHHNSVADVLVELATHRRAQYRYREAEPLLKRALEIRQAGLGPEHGKVAEVLDLLGGLHEEQGRGGPAGKAYSQALAIWEGQLGPRHPLVLQRLRKLALLYRLYGRFSLAEPLYQRILVDAALESDDPGERAQNDSNLALLYLAQGKFAEAEQGFLRALEVWKSRPQGQEDCAWTLDQLGEMDTQQGKFSQALTRLSQARSLWLKVLGKNHPDLCVNLELQARALVGQRKWSEAERFLRRALELKERFLGPLHRVCIRLLGSLAEVLRLAQKRGESLRLHRLVLLRRRQAIQAGTQLLRVDLPCGRYGQAELVALSYLLQAARSAKGKRYKELRHQCLAALYVREQALGPHHADLACVMDDLAELYNNHRRTEAALELYQRTLTLRRAWLGRFHPDVCLSLSAQVEIYRGQNRWDLAAAAGQDWLTVLEANQGNAHPAIALLLEKLADIYGHSGSPERQQECRRQAQEVRSRVLSTTDGEVALSLAQWLELEKEYADSARLYETAVGWLVDRSGPECLQLLPIYDQYATVLRKLERVELAVELETEAEILRARQAIGNQGS